jgi:hypothetical protein
MRFICPFRSCFRVSRNMGTVITGSGQKRVCALNVLEWCSCCGRRFHVENPLLQSMFLPQPLCSSCNRLPVVYPNRLHVSSTKRHTQGKRGTTKFYDMNKGREIRPFSLTGTRYEQTKVNAWYVSPSRLMCGGFIVCLMFERSSCDLFGYNYTGMEPADIANAAPVNSFHDPSTESVVCVV